MRICPCWFFRLTVSSNLTTSHRAERLALFDIILNGTPVIGHKTVTERFLQADEATMNTSLLIQNQLLVTKFYVPVTSGPLISRPRLTVLLNESLSPLSRWSRLPLASARRRFFQLGSNRDQQALLWWLGCPSMKRTMNHDCSGPMF